MNIKDENATPPLAAQSSKEEAGATDAGKMKGDE